MTPITLQALRRLFFFTTAEAAQYIAAGKNASGVPEQRWRQWESGELPIPENIAARMNELNEWRSLALDATADNIRIQMREKSGAPESIFVIWYDKIEDWLSLPKRDPVMWRLQQAVCASLLGMFSIVKLIPFDSANYHAWLAGREDSESLRVEWASCLA